MIKLLIGGEERSLDFTRMGVYAYIKKATGLANPFEFLKRFEQKDTVLFTIVEDLAVIVYAGINTALDIEEKENISFERVVKWVNAARPEDLKPVIESFFTGITSTIRKVEEKENSQGEAIAQEPKP